MLQGGGCRYPCLSVSALHRVEVRDMLTEIDRTMHTTDLRAYLAELPRGAVAAFAARVGCSRVYLSQLAARQNGREPGAELCVVIERASEKRVRRWDLRPSDWHLIWPELIGTEGAPPVPADAEVRDAA